jgi:Domain of unknown function (DUF4124)
MIKQSRTRSILPAIISLILLPIHAQAVNKCIAADGKVSFQDAPCPNTSKMQEKLEPRENVVGNGVGRVPEPRGTQGEMTAIRAKCAKDWPNDFRMRAYCEKKQLESLQTLQEDIGVAPQKSTTIRAKCASDWPDDFRMRAYCEKKQLEGLQRVQEPVGAGSRESRIIRAKCEIDWPNDYRMRAYCEKKQLEGLQQLAR